MDPSTAAGNRPALTVIDSARSGAPARAWADAAPRIAAERCEVEALLSSGTHPPVYGFTTLFGHYDAVESTADDQWTLLDAHLVGTPRRQTARFHRLLAATKLAQISHGGTGLSEEGYARLLAAAAHEGPGPEGAWLASYGAGDVVPAAWFAQALVAAPGGGTDGDADTAAAASRGRLATGDVMALINGNHCSTAVAVIALCQALTDLCAASHALQIVTGRVVHGLDAAPVQDRIAASEAPLGRDLFAGVPLIRDVQAPISLRDPEPIVGSFAAALGSVLDRIDDRLGRTSGNPLFVRDSADGPLHARSQSSFLDFELTGALTGLNQALLLAAGTWQRLITHYSQLLGEDRAAAEAPVQPAKVAQAGVEALAAGGAGPARFSGAESDGIEDLFDQSLTTAARTLEISAGLRELAAIGAGIGIPAGASAEEGTTGASVAGAATASSAVERALTRAAFGEAPSDPIGDAFAEEAAGLLSRRTPPSS